jgi:hypothetical protein
MGVSTLAYLDRDYELKGGIKRRGEDFTISEQELHSCFIKNMELP